MANITFTEAPAKLQMGVVGIGEHHDNHWGRMLALKLVQCPGATALLIEYAPDLQGAVDNMADASGAYDTGMAYRLDSISWQTSGVLPVSLLVYQARKRGLQVLCADHFIVYQPGRSTTRKGMHIRNRKTVQVLLSLADSPSDIRGVIMLGGAAHFKEGDKSSIPGMLEGKEGLVFNWVDASKKEGSGFGVPIEGQGTN